MRVATLAVRRGRGPRHPPRRHGPRDKLMPSAPPLCRLAQRLGGLYGLQGFGTAVVQIAQDVGNAVTPADRGSLGWSACVMGLRGVLCHKKLSMSFTLPPAQAGAPETADR